MSAIHTIIKQMCVRALVHVATANNETDLTQLATAESGLVFDLDIYRLLIRAFRKPNVNIIELPARSS